MFYYIYICSIIYIPPLHPMSSLKRNMPWATLDRPSSKATAAAKKGWGQWMFSALPGGSYLDGPWS